MSSVAGSFVFNQQDDIVILMDITLVDCRYSMNLDYIICVLYLRYKSRPTTTILGCPEWLPGHCQAVLSG